LEAIFSAINDGLAVHDQRHKIIYMNDALVKIVGNQVGETCYRALLGRDSPCLVCAVDELLHKGRQTMRGTLRLRDGRYVDAHCSPVSLGDGSWGVLEVLRDVTDDRWKVREAEREVRHLQDVLEKRTKELLESESMYRTFMETASDFMHISDKDGYILYANEAEAKALGYTKEELIGKHFTELIDDAGIATVPEELETLSREGRLFLRQSTWRSKNGGRVVGELSAVAIYDESGEYDGARVIVRDITDRKRLERQIEISERLAAIGQQAAVMAHEIISPLSGMRQSLERIVDKTDAEPWVRERLELCTREIDRVATIARRLQLLSGPTDEPMDEVDLGALAADAVDLVATLAEENGVAVEIDIPGGLPNVVAAETQIQEVFLNLAKNACEAMPDGGTLRVYAERGDDYVTTCFRDTGLGIPRERISGIFDAFYTTKPRGEGAGLGLSISYAIVRRHQGDIEVQTEVGKGSTFKVTLPVQQQRA
jgi:PAS domain S-box-containing protein